MLQAVSAEEVEGVSAGSPARMSSTQTTPHTCILPKEESSQM